MISSQRQKLTLCVLVLGILSFKSLAQNIYEGQVINKNSDISIPGVTVQLLKEKIMTSTSDQGYFKLVSENTVPNDTLVFSSVGYLTYRMPVSDYQKNTFIPLQSSNTTLDEVSITNRKLKVLTLNKFETGNIKEDKVYRTTPFSTRYSFAKLFNAPQSNVTLAYIEIGRREFDKSLYAAHPTITSNINTRFLIHVLSVDPKTGAPGDVIFTKSVTLTDNALRVRIDLSKDNIMIPSEQFCISIEWLRIPYNELVELQQAPKIRKITKTKAKRVLYDNVSQYAILYQPALIGYKRTKKAHSWIKTNKNTWVPYNSDQNDHENEIALSATINY